MHRIDLGEDVGGRVVDVDRVELLELRGELLQQLRGRRGLTETTICFAIAVVMQLGHLRLSASATLIGVIRSLWPTTSTSWKETASVVHALQLARA